MIKMALPPEYVDEHITERAYTIDENDTIQQARDEMKRNETEILVVTHNDMPVYILQKYQTFEEKPDTQIVKLASMGKLKPAEVVQSGALWSSVVPRLGRSTVLVVADTTTKVPQIRGTITTYSVKWKKR